MSDKQLNALKAIWKGIEDADKAVIAYLNAGGDSALAVAAMSHPMKGFQGQVEGKIFDLSPEALDELQGD